MGPTQDVGLEERKLQLEREKVALEGKKLEVERDKAKWTAIGSIVPIVVALGTIIYGVWSLRETAKAQFESKVAELALSAPNADAAKGRAQILALLFKDLLPQGFDDRLRNFNPSNYQQQDDLTLEAWKTKLFEAISAHPSERKQIIETWRQLFPEQTWVRDLK